jgi:glucose 1-dehydrogenase
MLKGMTALVTGASTGIGKAIAREFSKQGANVVINYIGNSEPANDLVDELTQNNSKAVAFEADISNQSQVNNMLQKAIELFGVVNILINNAGIEKKAPFLDKSLEEWDQVIKTDLTGPFICSQAVARVMVKNKIGGVIINISSVHEEIGFPGYSAYCAAKGGLRMLCRNLALELAPYGIRVVNVGPGAIATPINELTINDPKTKAALEMEIPLGRIGTANEVAKLVSYLASDNASYITGTSIFIDGGLMRQTGSL